MGKLTVPGETAIDAIVFVIAVTFSVAFPLTPLNEAITLVEPAATPVAKPLEFIVATMVFAAPQLAVEVTFAVEPSL
jgi:hypothetical protein